MNKTFVFPLKCAGLLHRWDSSEGISFVNTNSNLVRGNMIKGKPAALDSNSVYDPFEFDSLIPEFIKLYEKVENGGDLKKHIKNWHREWGPLYSDFTKNTVEEFLKECRRFYYLWNLYKWISNNEEEKIMECLLLEGYEDYKKITFFPNSVVFPKRLITREDENFDFQYSFPISAKIEDDFLEIIKEKSLVFLFKQLEHNTSNAKLTWGSFNRTNQKNSSTYKVEHVLQMENLIDAIYMQFYILFSENEKRICTICNGPYLPKRKDKKYCSKTCKFTAKSRRYRERKVNY